MRLTFNSQEEWSEERQKYIGGSDIAAIMGASHFQTALDIYNQYVNGYKIEGDALDFGHDFEDAVVRNFVRQTGAIVNSETEGDYIVTDDSAPFVGVSPDREATVFGEYALLEVKTSAIKFDPENLPEGYLLQTNYQMGATGIHVCYLVWLDQTSFFNKKVSFKRLEFDADLYAVQVEYARKFKTMVDAKTPPEPKTESDWNKTKEVKGCFSTADAELLDKFAKLRELKDSIDALKKQEDELKGDIIANYIKENEGVKDSEGKTICTYKERTSKKFDSKRFESENAELYKQYVKESSYRCFIMK